MEVQDKSDEISFSNDAITYWLNVLKNDVVDKEINTKIHDDTFMQFITNYIKTTNQFNGKMSFDEYLSQYIEAYVEHQLKNSSSTIYTTIKGIADKAVSDSKTTT